MKVINLVGMLCGQGAEVLRINGDASLREVGLCGSHAYSVLSVREVRLRGSGAVERLVRVRNPHGTGEWQGYPHLCSPAQCKL